MHELIIMGEYLIQILREIAKLTQEVLSWGGEEGLHLLCFFKQTCTLQWAVHALA